jgi:hypothetical protein
MALQQIIDRRAAGKNKSIGNRERFLRRHQDQIREAVRRAVQGRSIRDLERGEDIQIPRKDLSEPVLEHGSGGLRDLVHTGNRDYLTGDHIERPKGGQGGSGSQASDSGEGEDDFVFSLSKEEFMQIFFEDLACPTWCAPSWPRSRSTAATAPATPATAPPTTCMWCARCAAPWGGASRWAPPRAASCTHWKNRPPSCAASPVKTRSPGRNWPRSRRASRCSRHAWA